MTHDTMGGHTLRLMFRARRKVQHSARFRTSLQFCYSLNFSSPKSQDSFDITQ